MDHLDTWMFTSWFGDHFKDNIMCMCVGGHAYVYVFCSIPKSCLTFVIPWTVAHQTPMSVGFSR